MENNVKNYFSQNLRYIRQTFDLSRSDLGAIINRTKYTISGYENDLRQPKINELLKLCNYFGVTSYEMLSTDLSLRPIFIKKDSF